ncbi:MAG: hypothetical protein ACKO2N_12915 [Tabrizicola sp.]
MRSFLLAAVMALPITPAFADITVTTDRGGSAVVSRDCTRGDGQAVCTTQALRTGPEGKTASKTRVRTAERGFVSTSVSITGPEGNTRTRERSFARGD